MGNMKTHGFDRCAFHHISKTLIIIFAEKLTRFLKFKKFSVNFDKFLLGIFFRKFFKNIFREFFRKLVLKFIKKIKSKFIKNMNCTGVHIKSNIISVKIKSMYHLKISIKNGRRTGLLARLQFKNQKIICCFCGIRFHIPGLQRCRKFCMRTGRKPGIRRSRLLRRIL